MGCDAKPKAPGDDDAWLKYIEKWFLGGLAIGGILSYLNIAGAAPVVLSGGAATLAVLAVIIGALAGGTLAAFIGYAVEWSRRLKVQNPSQITIDAFVLCAGKNSGVPPFNDGDWTFNMAIPFTITDPLDAGLTMPVVRTRAAPDSGLATAFESVDGGVDVFHVEISSKVGDFGSVGGAVGSALGTIGGLIAGAAICAALGLVTFGIGFALCALIVALAALVGAIVGGFAGAAIGGGIGWIADQFSDFDKKGHTVQQGCSMFITGRWVTDLSHQHNEIHDMERAVLIDCGLGAAGAPLTIGLAGAVGTGRHPQGPDP